MADMIHNGTAEDQREMSRFKYKQELSRTMKLFGSFAVAFSSISITTGIFTNFSFVVTTGGTAGIWTWPIVSIGMLLVALVFAEISGVIPISGYSYQWVKKFANPGLGWFSGWVSFCFLFLVAPSIDSGLAPVFTSLVGIPQTASNLVLVAMAAFTLQMIFNILSVKISSVINNAAVYTEVIGILGLTIALLIAAFVGGHPAHNLVDTTPVTGNSSFLLAFSMCALMGFYTLVGFEVASNMSEETRDARKNVPKAIILSVLISGIFGTIFLIAVAMGVKDMPAVLKSASPIPLIIEANLGAVVSKLFLIVVIVSIFACGLVCSMSATRIVYVMARDDAFFVSKLFKKVNKKTSTPIAACVLLWVLGILSLKFSSSLTLLTGACAVLPAIYYLITVVSYARVRKKIDFRESGFNMGKFGVPVIIVSIVWLVLEICILTIPATFHQVTIVAAIMCALGVILYFAYFKQKIKKSGKFANDTEGIFISEEQEKVLQQSKH